MGTVEVQRPTPAQSVPFHLMPGEHAGRKGRRGSDSFGGKVQGTHGNATLEREGPRDHGRARHAHHRRSQQCPRVDQVLRGHLALPLSVSRFTSLLVTTMSSSSDCTESFFGTMSSRDGSFNGPAILFAEQLARGDVSAVLPLPCSSSAPQDSRQSTTFDWLNLPTTNGERITGSAGAPDPVECP